ncbi:MAG: hypothetical protein ACHQ2Z_15360, partial [Elusimicrobiota bacterium]
MRRAVLAVVVLLAGAPAFSASSSPLDRRVKLLLSQIRSQAAAGKKDTSVLRAELSGLEKENAVSPDVKVAAHLRLAEADLALVDAGTPLPPPTIDETLTDQDLPDHDAVAQPAQPARAPVYQNAGSAALPDSADAVFDGLHRRGGLGASSIAVPPEAPTANLDQLLGLEDDDADGQQELLVSASAGLIEKLKETDGDEHRAEYISGRLSWALKIHPRRDKFISLRLSVPEDKKLHLIYRERDGGAVDEILGTWEEWSRRPKRGRSGGGGGRRGGKKGSGGKKGDSADEGGGSSSGGRK